MAAFIGWYMDIFRRGEHIMTRTRIKFFVPGIPAPQGSKRALGPGRMIEMSKNVGPWRERIALAAHNAMKGQPLFPGPAAIFIEVVLPRPKSTPKSYTPAAIKRPDIDKLARACLDAITGVIIADDAQITELHATKRLAHIGETPGAALEIITFDPTTARST
jgi:crossover junction endodeoxyribonuclease RusA